MVAIKTPCTLPVCGAKTLYTLPSANQNSMHIAGLGLETLYTLSQLEQKLYIHCPISEPQ